jgi:hypothetical protein
LPCRILEKKRHPGRGFERNDVTISQGVHGREQRIGVAIPAIHRLYCDSRIVNTDGPRRCCARGFRRRPALRGPGRPDIPGGLRRPAETACGATLPPRAGTTPELCSSYTVSSTPCGLGLRAITFGLSGRSGKRPSARIRREDEKSRCLKKFAGFNNTERNGVSERRKRSPGPARGRGAEHLDDAGIRRSRRRAW